MRDEQVTGGVDAAVPGNRLPPAAPPPRPEAPADRPQPDQTAAVHRRQGSAPAAREAVVRSALGNTVAQFIVDPNSYEVRVRLIDPETRTVVREIPPGDLINLAKGTGTYQGILLDQSA